MDSYTKELKLKVKLDAKELDSIKEQITTNLRNVKMTGVFDSKQTAQLKQGFFQQQSFEKQVGVLQKNLQALSKLAPSKENLKAYQAIEKELKEVTKEKGGDIETRQENIETLKQKLIDGLSSAISKVGDFMKDTFTNAIQEATKMATFNLAESTKYSGEAIDLLETYGVTGAQAYGLSKAMEDVGISSQEDLMKAQAYQPEVIEKLSERVGYWSSKYEEDQETSKALQEFTVEFQEFKDELMMDVIEFFSQYKDELKAFLKFGITVLGALANVIGSIVSFFNKEGAATKQIATASDVVKNYTSSSQNTTNNNIDINVNGTEATQVGQNIYDTLQRKIAFK